MSSGEKGSSRNVRYYYYYIGYIYTTSARDIKTIAEHSTHVGLILFEELDLSHYEQKEEEHTPRACYSWDTDID